MCAEKGQEAESARPGQKSGTGKCADGGCEVQGCEVAGADWVAVAFGDDEAEASSLIVYTVSV